MALTLPLQVVDSVRRCCCSLKAGTSRICNADDPQLFDIIINQASIFDVIKWQRVSRGFRRAAHRRLDAYTRIDVRVYSGLQKLRNDKAMKSQYEWHPTVALMMVEVSTSHLGIAIDSELNWRDVKALLQLLITFRRKIQQLVIDSPIIEILVAEVNKQQVNLLLALLLSARKQRIYNNADGNSSNSSNLCCRQRTSFSTSTIVPLVPQWDNQQYLPPKGPFFPHLKQLTITSQSNQLVHLSRLLSYAVSVDLIYHVEQIDLLCLKICVGNAWSRLRNFRLFRHLTRFRQWTEASVLGERYFQQFGADAADSSRSKHCYRARNRMQSAPSPMPPSSAT